MKKLLYTLLFAVLSASCFAQIETYSNGESLNSVRTKINNNFTYLDENKVSTTFTRNRQTGDYTLVLTDNYKLVEINSASTQTVTVPPNSSVAFPADRTQIMIVRYGAGAVNIAAGVGVTIRSAGGALGLREQYSAATLIKIGTDEWYLVGDIE